MTLVLLVAILRATSVTVALNGVLEQSMSNTLKTPEQILLDYKQNRKTMRDTMLALEAYYAEYHIGLLPREINLYKASTWGEAGNFAWNNYRQNAIDAINQSISNIKGDK